MIYVILIIALVLINIILGEYVYNIEESFPTGFDSDSTNTYIRVDTTIGFKYLYLTSDSVNVTFYFNETLTVDELAVLNAIIAENLKLAYYDLAQYHKFTSNVFKTDEPTYTQLSSLLFFGERNLGSTSYIEIVANINNNTAADYDLKLVDVTNDNLIFEVTNLNNTVPDIIVISNLTNIPAERALLILYGRVNGAAEFLMAHTGYLVTNGGK